MTSHTKQIKYKLGIETPKFVNETQFRLAIKFAQSLVKFYEEGLFIIEIINKPHGTISSAKDIYDEILKDLHNIEVFEEETCKIMKEKAEKWKPVTEAYARVCKCGTTECNFNNIDKIMTEIIKTLDHLAYTFESITLQRDFSEIIRYCDGK